MITEQKTIKAAVFGFGYWGEKTAKALKDLGLEVLVIDPKDIADFSQISKQQALADTSIDYCFLITPEETHFALAKECLQAGKNVFVEKPLVLKASEAEELVVMAQDKKLQLWVDHVLLFDPAFQYFQQQVGELIGQVKIVAERKSMLHTTKKVSILVDLLPHEIYLIETLKPGFWQEFQIENKQLSETAADLQIRSNGGGVFQAHYDWASPVKQRSLSLENGSKKVVWQLVNGQENVEVYENGQLINKKDFQMIQPSPLEKMLQEFWEMKEINWQQLIDEVAVLEKITNQPGKDRL